MTTLRHYLESKLKADGYDGLCNDEAECGCDVNDLQPCSEPFGDCVPAYRWECQGCTIGESQEGCGLYEYMGGCYRSAKQEATP